MNPNTDIRGVLVQFDLSSGKKDLDSASDHDIASFLLSFKKGDERDGDVIKRLLVAMMNAHEGNMEKIEDVLSKISKKYGKSEVVNLDEVNKELLLAIGSISNTRFSAVLEDILGVTRESSIESTLEVPPAEVKSSSGDNSFNDLYNNAYGSYPEILAARKDDEKK